MKTAIIILNWNGRNLLESFLPGVVETARGIARVIVADNASTDNSLEWLQENFPDVELILNKNNEGFARGYNSALKLVEAEYFLLLNSDVEVRTGWLEPLIKQLDEDPGVAACQPKIRWHTHREKFEYAGAAGAYIDAFGYPFCRGRMFTDIESDSGQYDDTVPVFWASGACMMIRSSVFKELGGFDPVFFAHMEEIDLCWRIRNKGYEIMCIPSSVVFHVGGATLPKNNPRKTRLNFRNNLSMLYKNLPLSRLIPVLFARVVLDGVAGLKFLFESGPGDFFAVIQAHFQFYGNILTGKLRRNPSKIPGRHKTIYNGLIIWDYYLLKKKKFSDLRFYPVKSKP